MRYLIVEDDSRDVVDLQEKLEQLGINVTVLDPINAIEWNKEHMPDVVQIDGLGGICFYVYRDLRMDNPNAEYILFSSNQDYCELAERVGMVGLNKSEGASSVVKCVQRLLEEKPSS